MDNDTRHLYFSFFNEVGIIAQLSRAAMEARLPDGLTLPHFSVVNHLTRVRDGQTPLTLARAFQVPKTTMTHTLAGLLEHGLVEMRPNPEDGRSKTVWLTDQGRQFREDAIRSIDPDIADLKEAIPADRVADLLPLLSEIRAFMDAYRD
ncbi:MULTISPECIES: MarR family winged helix-turn-helix transcriptional regulator [Stappiaceae]|uniref:MarR family winged helix-turn-helix transcriptional regulator n=1 Tax=Stappiaceae TaxID=2821832 RepID=UPI000B8BF197|nr:MarR family transcriptional regulator [Labrenzia sp. VG12]ASP32513.1 MarR family transcriptional regulator [Labrenzia sp. VG12]